MPTILPTTIIHKLCFCLLFFFFQLIQYCSFFSFSPFISRYSALRYESIGSLQSNISKRNETNIYLFIFKRRNDARNVDFVASSWILLCVQCQACDE